MAFALTGVARKWLPVACGWLLAAPGVLAQAEHPHILLTRAEFAEWQAKASSPPWNAIEAKARADAALSYQGPFSNYKEKTLLFRDVVASRALVYILDDDDRAVRAQALHAEMAAGLADLRVSRPSDTSWPANVGLAMALFNGILALDVVRDDLTAAQIEALENEVAWFIPRIRDWWEPSLQSLKGLWALYQRDWTAFHDHRQAYDAFLFGQISEDGIPLAGAVYGLARFGYGDRSVKHVFMDIARKHGGIDYYADPRLQNLYAFIFGYGLTPFGEGETISDSSPNRTIHGPWPEDSNLGATRAARFSGDARAFALRHLPDPIPSGRLLSYWLADDTGENIDPVAAPSRIFPDGGAFFRSGELSPDELSGFLWNAKGEAIHQHKEVNAIGLNGYGRRLLVNAGYPGWESGAQGFSWNYFHNRAVSANTALIHYNNNQSFNVFNPPTTHDHSRKTGAGIAEGMVSRSFDYAVGDSGSALPNGWHGRTFAFVHPAENVPGYWLLFDQIRPAGTQSQPAHLVFRPPSTAYRKEGAHHLWTIPGSAGSDDVELMIGFGRDPVSERIIDGIMGNLPLYGQDNLHVPLKSLFATWTANPAVEESLATFIVPLAHGRALPSVERAGGTGWESARLEFGSLLDTVFTANAQTAAGTIQAGDGVGVAAREAWWRSDGAARVRQFFAREAIHFEDSHGFGFSASAPVSILFDRNGEIHVRHGHDFAVEVELLHESITKWSVEGLPAGAEILAPGRIRLSAPAGETELRFPGSFSGWRGRYFESPEDPAGDPLMDANQSGRSNLLEYTLGNSPFAAIAHASWGHLSAGATPGTWTLRFPEPPWDVLWHLEAAASLDGSSWQPWPGALDQLEMNGRFYRQAILDFSIASRHFIRLSLELKNDL